MQSLTRVFFESEMLRHDIDLSLIDDLNFRCTLELYRERFPQAYSGLGVLYEEIFGEQFENAHNSWLIVSRVGGSIHMLLDTREL
jgi:hypothetical protein